MHGAPRHFCVNNIYQGSACNGPFLIPGVMQWCPWISLAKDGWPIPIKAFTISTHSSLFCAFCSSMMFIHPSGLLSGWSFLISSSWASENPNFPPNRRQRCFTHASLTFASLRENPPVMKIIFCALCETTRSPVVYPREGAPDFPQPPSCEIKI